MNTFPQLTTNRLLLRNFTKADAQAVFAIFSDARVTEFYDLDTFTLLEQAEQIVASRMQSNAEPSSGQLRWAICLSSAPDTVIGSCGFHSCNSAFQSIEIGYELHPDYWGKGYALEAIRAMLDFCFTSNIPFHVNRVAATTDLDSHRSIALLRKLGFAEEGVLRQYGFWKGSFHDVRLFALLREQWFKDMKLE